MIIRGQHHIDGSLVDVICEAGRISAILPSDASRVPTEGDEDCLLAPGLLDIQVNGYSGFDFSAGVLSPEEIEEACRRLEETGVTGFCPTVITASSDSMLCGVSAIARACETSTLARRRILGIHLEGPYISPVDGPRGAHPSDHVRLPDWDEFVRLQQAADGLIRIITLAPELPGALDFVTRAVRKGVIVALGHHQATGEMIATAVHSGAKMSTHLGNGAHRELPRHPNYIWEQLAHDGLAASIIADGHHLPPEVIKAFYRVKGGGRLILVSDAVQVAGYSPGSYETMGIQVELQADGSVRLPGTPYLAGSAMRLSDGIQNMMQFAGASFSEASQMASTNPSCLLGLSSERGVLRVGTAADLALFDRTRAGIRLKTAITAETRDIL